jgi:hypothetical protein
MSNALSPGDTMRAHIATFGTSDLRDDLADARRELALYRLMLHIALGQLHHALALADRQRDLLEMAAEERRRYVRAVVLS